MSYQPNTYLNLSLPSNESPTLDLVLDPSSSCSSSPLKAIQPRFSLVTIAKRKFYTSQAHGGHQNAPGQKGLSQRRPEHRRQFSCSTACGMEQPPTVTTDPEEYGSTSSHSRHAPADTT
ncbi:Zinc finger protein 2 [Camellia lanceoleosa]|uniref:Zinc finger protein 2 n=1 Tax=Camellia lanceoleosa TaxID=1840588 RepID=A0ACC0HL46_9ERIC|nr:Zinc finger protein 2 [Camellia lanceoleosa]